MQVNIPAELQGSEFVVEAVVSLSTSNFNVCHLTVQFVGGGATVIADQAATNRQVVIRGFYDKANREYQRAVSSFGVECNTPGDMVYQYTSISAQVVDDLSGTFPTQGP